MTHKEFFHLDGRLSLSRYVLFFVPAIVGVTADLVSKWWVFDNYFDPDRAVDGFPQFAHWWIDGIWGIQTSTNPGALFGMGSGLSWLFAGFSVIALIGVLVWMFVFAAARDRWLAWAAGMISGGILGNLYDRIGLGYVDGWPASIRTNVRDFLLFRLEGVPFFDPWPNFNIADALLVCGAILLMFHAFFLAETDDEVVADDSPQPELTSDG